MAFCIQAMSPPAQKARPAPVRTTMSASSSWRASTKMRDSSVCSSALAALSCAGRLSVSVRMRPRRSARMVL
jgi:hypothetical protein